MLCLRSCELRTVSTTFLLASGYTPFLFVGLFSIHLISYDRTFGGFHYFDAIKDGLIDKLEAKCSHIFLIVH